jgi:uncharacterized protein (TIGR03790 family)
MPTPYKLRILFNTLRELCVNTLRELCVNTLRRARILQQVSMVLLFATALAAPAGAADAAAPMILPTSNALQASQLGIIINDSDPLSRAIGRYYQQRRKIPADNVVRVRFKPGATDMSPGEFAVLKRRVDESLPPGVQALALTWAAPFRVGCMSITSAFAFGYDVRYCAQGCKPTAFSGYADSSTPRPFDMLDIRPTMMLAATSKQLAFSLIERGIESDFSTPAGTAYLIETDDRARSVRKVLFPEVRHQFGDKIPVRIERTQALKNADDVMFYLTGLQVVPDIETNRYLPGAVADHLTSFGGQLTNSSQMSSLRWLEAGATGSYGTVVEPCAFIQKFPNPQILLKHYLAGETLIEAYWKSVLMPGQGVFIGEPLARPYAGYSVQHDGQHWFATGPAVQADAIYTLYAADKPQGPFTRVATDLKPSEYGTRLLLPAPVRAYYRLEPRPEINLFTPAEPDSLPPHKDFTRRIL